MHDRLSFQKYQRSSSSSWLVLIHGLFGDSDNLSALRRHFESKINVLSVDLLDHGRSVHTSEFQLEDNVTALFNTLDELEIQQANLLGHSLGGKVAMLAALRSPQRVSNLMVADIAPVTYPARHQSIFAGLNSVDLETLSSRRQADEQMKADIPENGIRQFLLKGLYQHADNSWQWRFNLKGLSEHYDNVTSWPESNTTYPGPTLFIKGGDSDYITSAHRSAIAQYFPAAKAHILESAGHWLHAEKPAMFNRIVEKFLKHQLDQ
ncbi:alpha/beta fold hydrolase [Alteromonas aestuariivivens]|uniref:Alpha/beta fold hydrolase n=1 Tax=Alteromonas aestuariivivens TaxID=1938339 RepID=A0A3D8MB82_9ALTE|nr:alpha/beta fold hydrolase [Alteromonas aestuariivivens]RDV27391.1 alpha/beta fold hydrolase [Alteromonas aestuariivivens]